MSLVFAYITTDSLEEAKRIGKLLVEERLAACVNLFDNMTSLYRWQSEIAEECEVVILAKTRSELFEQLAERVKAVHGYEVPCIIEIPLGRVSAGYHSWLWQETKLSD